MTAERIERPAAEAAPRVPLRRRLRPVIGTLSVVAILLVIWEVGKAIFGDPWRYDSFLGTGIAINFRPPLKIIQFNDLNLPHIWDVIASFGDQSANGQTYFASLVGSALFTLRGAALGFVLGTLIGLGLAVLLIHVRVLERGLVPLLVASQTIPIVAIAPIVVVGLKAGWFGVAIVASYLTFFPVTIAAIRGLRAADPRAFELMRSYAATRTSILAKLRFPASAPYVFTAFKVSATASVVGAIVGEFPAGIREGLGGALLQAMQYYSINPGRLWAAILVTAAVGIGAFLLVVVVERRALRSYRPVDLGAAA
ncbi:MAG TPA: ABC transporter permease subunit [Candidatus Limnocylindria bacterium]|nr:ABC transporter permease subunit [Candidatus Limnocylindria bacterium]